MQQNHIGCAVKVEHGQVIAVRRPTEVSNKIRVEGSNLMSLRAIEGLQPDVIHALQFDHECQCLAIRPVVKANIRRRSQIVKDNVQAWIDGQWAGGRLGIQIERQKQDPVGKGM